ncbi:MAG: hypothetical protein OEV24_20130 [Cyclobacteriaceae bacterium]|nr:hypothetical protein [Cyclobacteriaceae bacterium]
MIIALYKEITDAAEKNSDHSKMGIDFKRADNYRQYAVWPLLSACFL